MAILPLPQPRNLDVPTYPVGITRAPESTWTNLAGIGQTIADYRDQQALASVLAGATDAKGNLDLNKAATAIALSGRDPTRYLSLLEASKRAQEAAEYRKESLGLTREQRDIERQKLEQPQIHIETPSLMRPGGVYSVPRKPGAVPSYTPFPPNLVPATPGPQSELQPTEIPGTARPVSAADLETASPFQVAQAGPLTVQSPTQKAEAKKAAATFNEDYLRSLPTEGARTIVKGVANYEIDPSSFAGKDREDILAAAKTYRPDYSMSEYQKRATPPSGETQARLALAKAFLNRTDAIRERLQGGELSWDQPGTKAMAMLGQGAPGELRAAIDEGAEGLERLLTGAAMPASEAANYARRYTFSALDTKETLLRKLNGLENANRWMITEVGSGRGGEDLLKGFQDKFGKDVIEKAAPTKVKSDAEVNRLVIQARGALARDPNSRDEVLKILRDRGVPNPETVLGR